MLQSISPYALLCASKPKPAPVIVTPYDLYSRESWRQERPDDESAAQPPAPPPPMQPTSLARRTHYIADIQSRHSAAIRNAAVQHPLP